jgi:nucleoside-diphosphate-sugar epimerase
LPLVLILGSEGLVGRAVRRRLGREAELALVDIEPAERPEGRCFELDMGAPEDIDRLFDALSGDLHRVAGIVHLVAYYDFRNTPDARYTRVERGLEHLLRRAGERLPADAPVLYASSMASLAPSAPGEKLTPESPRVAGWAYPAHKIRCEQILEAWDIPQPRVELVLAGVYTAWAELVPLYQHIERVRASPLERRFYPGPTDRGLTYVHEDDAAEAFARALRACRGRSGVHRYLIGEEHPVTYAQIQTEASRAFFEKPLKVLRVPKVLARQGARVLDGLARLEGASSFIKPWMVDFAGEHFEFDLTKTKAELGWTPRHHLADLLPTICARARKFTPEWKRRNAERPF